jgi:hypothetical protein
MVSGAAVSNYRILQEGVREEMVDGDADKFRWYSDVLVEDASSN